MSMRKTNSRKSRDNNELPTTPAEATNTRHAATTSKASRKDRQISSSFLTNPKRRKYPSSPDWDSQITLTQLVPKADAETPDDGSGLVQYVQDGTTGMPAEVINLADDTDENDESWRPSTNRRPSAKGPSPSGSRSPNSIPTTTFKRRKSSVLISGGSKLSKPTKGRKKKWSEQKGTKRNKTLTQMDFVRRFIPLPDSDDDDLNLYEGAPSGAEKNVEKKEDIVENKMNNAEIGEFEYMTPKKRRKLDHDNADPSPAIKSDISPEEKKPSLSSVSSAQPKTPQKSRLLEIPSSQTPETPRQTFVASPSIRRVSRFSLEAPSLHNTETPPLVEQVQEAPEEEERKDQQTHQPDPTLPPSSYPDNDIIASTMEPSSQLLEQGTANQTIAPEAYTSQYNSQPPEPPAVLSVSKKTIIYDTDEETDYGDIEDDNLPQISIGAKALEEWTQAMDSSVRVATQNCDYSDDLPLIPNSGTDLEIHGNLMSDTALPSDSSVYYRRPARYTQYPNEPIPMMNTQKIAELFPVIENDDNPAQISPPSTREPAASTNHDRLETLGSEMETPTQDDSVTRSIQVVPESSPITRSYDAAKPASNTMAPPIRESIILVESSQLVDRLNRQNDSMETGKSLRRLFSSRDFLTDSVMESIPAPPWMASQDSFGDPYPENDGLARRT